MVDCVEESGILGLFHGCYVVSSEKDARRIGGD
jgi:hypothetical protein